MDPQLQEMQKQIAELVTSVAVLRATCATKEDVAELRHEIRDVRERLDGVTIRLDTELPNLARKVETEVVRSETRSWMIGLLLIVLSTIFTVQFAAYRMLNETFTAQIAAALRAAPVAPVKN